MSQQVDTKANSVGTNVSVNVSDISTQDDIADVGSELVFFAIEGVAQNRKLALNHAPHPFV